ncbi:transposase [Amycolatopsis sp.]|uniref:IS701 family transposase n=1 Tax=Amycolatopsis sp. TaxID=37632 RepID=UPI00262C497F|nr:transposase [Amycolatopsis sp.]
MSVSQLCTTAIDDGVRVRTFVEDVFTSLHRVEQHRWARAYLNGLVRGSARKAPLEQAYAARLPQATANGLHHFINASPWDWQPVRRRLALRIAANTTPYAWTVAELITPKRGEHSVGVHRRLDAATTRTINCQRSLGFFLATDAGCFPVDWSLVLKDTWDWDGELRSRARIPDSEASRPVGAYVLDYADNAAAEPGLPNVPWMLDLTRCDDAAGVLAGLVRRHLDFACEVDPGQLVVTGRPSVITVGALMETRRGQQSHMMTRQAADGRSNPVEIYAASVRLPLHDTFTDGKSRMVRVLEWPDPNRQRPSRYWITGFTNRRVGEVLSLVRARVAALATVAELDEHFGASDFEGRSFPGWHHHMTMTSAAYAFQNLRGADDVLPAMSATQPTKLARTAH